MFTWCLALQRFHFSELPSLSPYLLPVEASQDSALGPQQLSLSLVFQKAGTSAPPRDLTVTSTLHSSLNPSSLDLPEISMPTLQLASFQSLAPSFSGQLQVLVSFWTLLSLSLLHQSVPNPQPMSHSTSHHVIPGHC